MKLNIGCGYNYLPGWVNLDSDPACRPDVQAQAYDLPFADGGAGEAMALHVVEHLGFFKVKYFLSECWRVLVPGGGLALELPDIERTFRTFLDGDEAAREASLGWVYGAETAGMGHSYCPPKELLLTLLGEAGFIAEKTEEYLYQPHRPALRIAAVKKEGERAALNAALRRRLLDAGVPCFGSELCLAGQEAVQAAVLAAHGSPEKVFAQTLSSARLAMEYFRLSGENELHESPYAAACERLAAWGLQGRMAASALISSEGGAAAADAFAAGLALGRAAIDAAAAGGPLPGAPGPDEGAPAVFTLPAIGDWLGRQKVLRRG